MKVVFTGSVEIPDVEVDSASDLEHSLIHYISLIIQAGVNVDDIFDRLGLSYEIKKE